MNAHRGRIGTTRLVPLTEMISGQLKRRAKTVDTVGALIGKAGTDVVQM